MALNLYISLYPENNPERRNELLTCLKNNSKVFDQIFVLAENGFTIEHEKVIVLPVTVRPTFRTFFNCVNQITKVGDINCVANSDVYFEQIPKLPLANDCFALTRYEVDKNGHITFLGRKDSQDSYFFNSTIRIPKYCDFVNWPGCDNRICWELMNIGYNITNPSLTIKSYHLHLGAKSYDGTQKVNRPYHFLTPTE